MSISTANPRTIGVGTTSESMDLEAIELQRISTIGLTIGKYNEGLGNKDIRLIGIDKTHSNSLLNLTTLLALTDNSKVLTTHY